MVIFPLIFNPNLMADNSFGKLTELFQLPPGDPFTNLVKLRLGHE